VTLPRNLIQTAFPNQPRMQQAFEALVTDAEDATARLNAALEAIGTLGDGAEGILAALADKQPKNAALTSISILGSDPGVLEQVQAGIYSIRPIDTADTAALMTRALADTRYLGGAHAAASATKLATARTITASGDAAWSVSFDGSANVSAALILATVNANTGTFGGAKTSAQVSLDGKGRVTSASAVTITPDYSSIGIVPTSRFLGRVTAGTGSAEALTGTQATALLDTFTSALKGLVPASGGGTTNFLRADGTWAAAGAPTGAALTKTDDTNVTLTLGGTPAAALLAAASLTLGWTGQLAVGRGGTGIASYAVGDIVYASAGTTLSKLAAVATGNVLISGGVTTAPSWGKVGLTTHVSGTLPVANGGTGTTTSTGTGNVVLSASPTFTGTPVLPTPSATALTLSGASNVGGAYATAAYRKYADGRVSVEGWLLGGGGTSPIQIATLPAGARPIANQTFPCINYASGTMTIGMFEVQSTGGVFWYSGNTSANFSISGINFQT
jgi:hypothetical protein